MASLDMLTISFFTSMTAMAGVFSMYSLMKYMCGSRSSTTSSTFLSGRILVTNLMSCEVNGNMMSTVMMLNMVWNIANCV